MGFPRMGHSHVESRPKEDPRNKPEARVTLSLLIVRLLAPLGQAAAQGLINQEADLVRRFDRICVEASPGYSRAKCVGWWNDLSKADQRFVKAFYTGARADLGMTITSGLQRRFRFGRAPRRSTLNGSRTTTP